MSDALDDAKDHVHAREIELGFSFIVVASVVCVLISMYKFGESVGSYSVEDT